MQNPSNAANFDPNVSLFSVYEVSGRVPVHCEDPYLQTSVLLPDPGGEDDGELGQVWEGGEVSVGREDFILRHAELSSI